MSILRKDPVSGGWVIFAEERARRVPDYQSVHPATGEDRLCPFCEGNESATPHEIHAIRPPGASANGPSWSLRVIPNKFAVLRIEGDLNRSGDGIYDMMNGVGAHEIIIETPRHDARMGDYSQGRMEQLIRAYRDRVVDLHRDQRFKYVQIFRNYGTAAGALMEHPHSQLIALPIAPRWIKEELANAREHYAYKERCLFCDIVNQEARERERVVFENRSFLAFAPFAAKFPFETWILPKAHAHDFQFLADSDIAPLAEALRKTIHGIQLALDNPPFNFIIHSAPRVSPSSGGIQREFHWHIEIIPRITRIAGFEWGTGFYINSTLPEQAAEFLRNVLREHPEPEQPVE